MLLDDTPLVIVLLVASHALVCWVTWLLSKRETDSVRARLDGSVLAHDELERQRNAELSRLRLENARLSRQLRGPDAPRDRDGQPIAEARQTRVTMGSTNCGTGKTYGYPPPTPEITKSRDQLVDLGIIGPGTPGYPSSSDSPACSDSSSSSSSSSDSCAASD